MNSAGVALIVLGIIALLISLSIHKIDEGIYLFKIEP